MAGAGRKETGRFRKSARWSRHSGPHGLVEAFDPWRPLDAARMTVRNTPGASDGVIHGMAHSTRS